ncbi:MAG: hypothetical protein FWE88_08980 [Phycisphaerae bacterium]|nr:hypothetical protein [Phycisphaerae bacterium]
MSDESEKTPQQVRQLQQRVQELLDAYVQQEKFDFRLIVAEAYMQQEGFLQILVLPDREGVSGAEYSEVLTVVEHRLSRLDHVEHVMLMPALAA